ncbi:hypothetical protein [Bacillus paranthracis]|uniref:hypothetical protein n=1 Tax=Bacillus paranthracis TaxID=2026186 RepID=UPI0021FA5912|nr:hypothetical protein [Bacillus paranthracis]UXR28811.1 hypothetical protein [Bacillus phage Nachito]
MLNNSINIWVSQEQLLNMREFRPFFGFNRQKNNTFTSVQIPPEAIIETKRKKEILQEYVRFDCRPAHQWVPVEKFISEGDNVVEKMGIQKKVELKKYEGELKKEELMFLSEFRGVPVSLAMEQSLLQKDRGELARVIMAYSLIMCERLFNNFESNK